VKAIKVHKVDAFNYVRCSPSYKRREDIEVKIFKLLKPRVSSTRSLKRQESRNTSGHTYCSYINTFIGAKTGQKKSRITEKYTRMDHKKTKIY